ncbi:MAG TPA: TlyA family RNA methyltransferase, partial [Myxococcaceae bacterium]|nr:TlyA family RNA methyltransferase [Myxococcaceae bacterium]
LVADHRVDKPGSRVAMDAQLRLKGQAAPYVSRGGLKLEKALAHFEISLKGKVCADIGASTGGFSDCMLQGGAARVYAIDVGHGQLHHKLRADPRVIVRERVNARFLSEADLPELVDAAAIDVSFISLRLVIPAVLPRLKPSGVLIALVKPQFEVGRSQVGKGGVVKDPAAREEAIEGVAAFMQAQKLELIGRVDSPIAGPAGNLEVLIAARKM